MESTGDQVRSFALSVLMHAFLVLMVWFGIDWIFPPHDVQAAGEPLQATLQVSQADVRKARAAMDKAEKAEKLAAPKPKPQPPQPRPEPRPQDSPTPPQPKPQEQLARPDTEVQPAVSAFGTKPPEPDAKEQERKQRQEQAELTADIAKQQEVEKRQRLQAQMLEIQRQRQEAERRTKLEEQRMQQLADVAGAQPRPREAAPAAAQGAQGPDEALRARYIAAMRQTADQNWNHTGAPELMICRVKFTQIPGGEVIKVEFTNCPYDADAREFVERALMKTPMPYSGFEPVFMRQVELGFCYPRENCKP